MEPAVAQSKRLKYPAAVSSRARLTSVSGSNGLWITMSKRMNIAERGILANILNFS